MAKARAPTPKNDFSNDDLIICGICHTELEDARSLVCLHTYCLECLREWGKPIEEEIICPACRESTPFQENGVDGLRRNVFVTKLKDRKRIYHQLMDTNVKISCTCCDVSEGNEALGRCLECDDFLCKGCIKAHKTVRLSKNHTVVTLAELRSGKSSLLKQSKEDHCQDHPGQVMWFYCLSCDLPICRDCTVINHPLNSHELINLDESTANQWREEIQKSVALCKVKEEEVDKGMNEIHKMQSNLESIRNATKNKIDARKEFIKRLLIINLKKQASDLKTEFSELMHPREKAVSIHEDQLQILKCRLKAARDMASHVARDGSDSDVASAYKHISTTLHQLGQITTPTIDSVDLGPDLEHVRFVENSRIFVGSIGTIEQTQITKRTHDVKETEECTSIAKKPNWNDLWMTIRKFGNAGMFGLSARGPRGVAINQDGTDALVAVADEGDSEVKIFDLYSGEFQMSIDTKQGLHSKTSNTKSSPQDILWHKDTYIVNDKSDNLSVYNRQGKLIRHIPMIKRGGSPKGLAINSHGHILVGNLQVKTLDMYRYSNGKHIKSLNIRFPVEYIAISNSTDDKIVVSNHTVNGCMVMDSEGRIIHILRLPAEVTTAWYPTGVCIACNGDEEEVIVANYAWSAHAIYRFSLTTGKYLGRVTDDVKNPCGIAFTDGQLVVVSRKPAWISVFSPILQ